MTEIFTCDNKKYFIRPIKGKGQGRNTLAFDVKCSNDAHIVLLNSDEIAFPLIEIFIGGWGNQKSAIRLNQTQSDKVKESTPLSQSKSIGVFGFVSSTMSYKLERKEKSSRSSNGKTLNTLLRSHISVSPLDGGPLGLGFLTMQDEQSSSSSSSSSEDEDPEKNRQRGKKPFYRRPDIWLDVRSGNVPLRAVIGGLDSSGEKIYVGRVKKDGVILPGKVVPSHKSCYVAYSGAELGSSKFQVLVRNKCCDLTWISASDGTVPVGALQGGLSKEKEPTFVGRILHDGATALGSAQPSRGSCFCSYGGEEVSSQDYEVLAVKYLPF